MVFPRDQRSSLRLGRRIAFAIGGLAVGVLAGAVREPELFGCTEITTMPARALSLVEGEGLDGWRCRQRQKAEPSAEAAADPRRRTCPLALVRKAKGGSRRAFDALWHRYAPTVHALLLTMVSDHEVDDLAQDVAVSAFRALPDLENDASFPAWLCAIARNAGRDALAAGRTRHTGAAR